MKIINKSLSYENDIPTMRSAIANVGYWHVTNIRPITANIGIKKPIDANTLLVFVLLKHPLRITLLLKTLADKFNKDDIMYGRADIKPFFLNIMIMNLLFTNN